jgi:hypothetical protein
MSLDNAGLVCVVELMKRAASGTVEIKSGEAVGPSCVQALSSSTVKIYGAVLMICECECSPISIKLKRVIFFNFVGIVG